MTSIALTPARLTARLAVYFVILLGGIIVLGTAFPNFAKILPIGGTDAIEVASLQIDKEGIRFDQQLEQVAEPPDEPQMLSTETVLLIAAFLCISLAGTILIMIPITWTYMATKREVGYRRNFVRALVVLPICATTIVLLIQDSLALAFGLAAMVAAVRFRVALREAIDGIYIFAAICVGLAAGIGHLGVGAIMALFFCFANAILWHLDYGQNPIDDAKRQKKNAALS